MKFDRCKQCGAKIIWVANAATGKKAALDAHPWEDYGNIMLHEDRRTYQVLSAEVASNARARKFPLYTNHFATCPGHERTTKLSFDEGEVDEHASTN